MKAFHRRYHFVYNLIAVSLVFALGCSNPANDVTKANVSDTTGEDTIAMEGDKYLIADSSTIEFVGSKVTGSHDGGFNEFTGEFYMQGDDFTTAQGKVEIDMKSIWSDNERLTGHLKNEDFFEVETYPTSTFVCKTVKKEGDQYTISGTLTMHGITKAIEFPAEISKSGDEITLNAEFTIQRFDWDIKYKGRADDLIYNDVILKLNLKANKA